MLVLAAVTRKLAVISGWPWPGVSSAAVESSAATNTVRRTDREVAMSPWEVPLLRHQEARQRVREVVRRFFSHVMPRIDAVPPHVQGPVPPDRERVAVEVFEVVAQRPQDQERATNPVAGGSVCFLMLDRRWGQRGNPPTCLAPQEGSSWLLATRRNSPAPCSRGRPDTNCRGRR
jgi:hypothetical protein